MTKDPLWTPKLKKMVNLEENLNDGIFFMEFSDFKKYFRET